MVVGISKIGLRFFLWLKNLCNKGERKNAMDKSFLDAIREASPADLIVEVRLVPFGYKLTFTDGEGNDLGFVCRDFGDNYSEDKMKVIFQAGFIHVGEVAEKKYKEIYKEDKKCQVN